MFWPPNHLPKKLICFYEAARIHSSIYFDCWAIPGNFWGQISFKSTDFDTLLNFLVLPNILGPPTMVAVVFDFKDRGLCTFVINIKLGHMGMSALVEARPLPSRNAKIEIILYLLNIKNIRNIIYKVFMCGRQWRRSLFPLAMQIRRSCSHSSESRLADVSRHLITHKLL